MCEYMQLSRSFKPRLTMNLPFLSRRSKPHRHGHRKPRTRSRSKPPPTTQKPPETPYPLPIQPTPPKPLIPKNQNPQLSSPLCQLPLDIMQIIYQSLPKTAKTALALTCHGFWANRNLAAIRFVKANQLRRAKFLDRLDDNPGFLRCSACVTTHPLRGYEAEDTPTGVKLSGGGKCEGRTGEVRVCGHYRLSYRMFLLVLRAERLGEGYGLPVIKLEHSCKVYPWSGRDLEMETHVKGRVVDGRLLLRLSYRIRVDLRKTEEWNWEKQVKAVLRRPELPQPMFRTWKALPLGRGSKKKEKDATCHPAVDVGCIHSHTCLPQLAVTTIRSYAEHIKNVPDRQLWADWGLNPSIEHCRKIHQCRFCATDFTVDVSPTEEAFQCLLHIVAYKELGSNLPHTSTLWAAATHPFGYVLDRSKALPYFTGSVRSQFGPSEHQIDQGIQWNPSEKKLWTSHRCLQEWKKA